MRAGLALLLAGLAATAALADKRVDPDPAFLPKARTAGTARVEPHYDLPSEKAPFWARFLVCAGNLTAIRDVGQALPASKDELDKAIADYRKRAADLLAYRAKTDTKAAPLDADAEVSKIRSGAMEFLPADIKRIGVETMTKRATERYIFCQLTRDWYDVQNGAKQETAAADQEKLTAEYEAAMKQIAELSAKPPNVWQPKGAMSSMIRPKVVQPEPAAPRRKGPQDEPMPNAKVVVPSVGTPVSTHPKDAIVGSDVASAVARATFMGRPLWSAVAECSARSEVVQAKMGYNTQQQTNHFIERAAYLMWGDREVEKANAIPIAMKERDRLRPRAAALWDAYRQEHAGDIPPEVWAEICTGVEKHAYDYSQRLRAARQAQQNREYAEYLKKFYEARNATAAGTETTSGGYYMPSRNTSLDAAAAASRAEHQRNMQSYKDNIARIKSEIRAIDRKYR
ncbi:MAG: hypothetical protein WDO17_23775 [Alphaproteobacteria bacterium]